MFRDYVSLQECIISIHVNIPDMFADIGLPIGSTYGIFTYIYHKNQLSTIHVGKYTIHGSQRKVSLKHGQTSRTFTIVELTSGAVETVAPVSFVEPYKMRPLQMHFSEDHPS